MNFKLFRPLGSKDIQKSTGASLCEFKSWIAQGKYHVSNISSNGNIELFITDHDFLNETLSYDFSRFACAAFESMREIKDDKDFPKATAWAAIKAYYSAFFAAHAILRYFGTSCSQIEPAQASILTKYASIFGVTTRAQSGFYVAEFNSTTNIMKLNKLTDTHKDTWTCFNSKLKALAVDVLSVPGLSPEKNEISDFLLAISHSLQDTGRLGSGNWLSTYRNNVNYKQSYDAWFPYKKGSLYFYQIEKYICGWPKPDFNPNIGLLEKDERLRFFGTCSAIINLLNGLSSDLAGIAAKGSVHKIRTSRLASMALRNPI